MTDKTCWREARLQPSFRALWMDSKSPSNEFLLYNLNKNFKTSEETAMTIMDHPNVLKLLDVRKDADFK